MTSPLDSVASALPFADLVASSMDAIVLTDGERHIVYLNPAAERLFNCSRASSLGKSFEAFVAPSSQDSLLTRLAEIADVGSVVSVDRTTMEILGRRSNGEDFPAESSIRRIKSNDRSFYAITLRDISVRKRNEALSHGQNQVLQMIVQNTPLNETLTRLIRVIEEQCPGMLGSILLLDLSGTCLRHGAAPSLPAEFSQLVEGHPLGPCAASCGTAAFRRSPVFVTDITIDPLWASYRGIAERFGLRACWSTPVFSGDHRLLGTFAMYYTEPRSPTPAEMRLIDIASRFASIAIERSSAEASLRDSEARFRTLVEQATDGIFISSAEGRFLEVNASACEMFGYTRDEFLELSIRDMVVSREMPRLVGEAHRLHHGGSTTNQWTCKRKSGSVFSGETTAKRLPDGRLVGILRDVTARKQAEDNMRRRAQEFAALYDTAQALVEQVDVGPLFRMIVERARSLLHTTSAAVMLYDRDRGDLVVTMWIGTRVGIPIGTRVLLDQGVMGRVARSRRPMAITDYEHWEYRNEEFGRLGIKSVLEVPMLFGGELIGVLGVADHVTLHEFSDSEIRLLSLFAAQAAAAIRNVTLLEQTHAAEEKYRRIFEDAVEGVFQSTPDGRLLTANPALARMLGYESPRALIDGLTDVERELYVDPTRRAEFRRLLTEKGLVTGFEFQLRRRDQRIIWVTENAHAVRDPSGQLSYYEGTMLDITGRKELEAQLRQAQKMEALGMLAGGVAHDFNNLLTVINAHADLLLNAGVLSLDVQPAIQEIQTAGQRAATLTRQLLTFSRKQILRTERIDLNETTHNVSRMLRRVIGEDIRLDLQLGGPLPPIQADRGMIEQVLVNLAINARDAMPAGGVIKITTDVGVYDPPALAAKSGVVRGTFVRMVFSDTGCGIGPETMPHIFEPFFTTKEPGKGTGLGLATVFGILQQHRGWIAVDSRLGAGTQFSSYWPVNTEPATTRAVASAPLKHPGGRETVLLVEDEPAVRDVAGQILLRLGYRVIEAGSGTEALDTWRKHAAEISALITDEVMPGAIRGTELATRLLREKPNLAVVFTSGYTGRAEHSLPTKRSLFLAKPYSVQTLAVALREVLDAPVP